MGWVYMDLELPIPPLHSPLHSPHLQFRKGPPGPSLWGDKSSLHEAPTQSPLAGLVDERNGSPVCRSGCRRHQRQTLVLLRRWGGWCCCKLLGVWKKSQWSRRRPRLQHEQHTERKVEERILRFFKQPPCSIVNFIVVN